MLSLFHFMFHIMCYSYKVFFYLISGKIKEHNRSLSGFNLLIKLIMALALTWIVYRKLKRRPHCHHEKLERVKSVTNLLLRFWSITITVKGLNINENRSSIVQTVCSR